MGLFYLLFTFRHNAASILLTGSKQNSAVEIGYAAASSSKYFGTKLNREKLGQIWANLDKIWANLGEIWAKVILGKFV